LTKKAWKIGEGGVIKFNSSIFSRHYAIIFCTN